MLSINAVHSRFVPPCVDVAHEKNVHRHGNYCHRDAERTRAAAFEVANKDGGNAAEADEDYALSLPGLHPRDEDPLGTVGGIILPFLQLSSSSSIVNLLVGLVYAGYR